MQHDWVSCGTFAYKVLKYCAKHGDELFAHLAKAKSDPNLLQLKDLPATLRKMDQSGTYERSIENKQEKQIVSKKANLTEEEYLAKHTVVIGDKKHNVATSIKRYKYIHEVEVCLTNLLTPTEQKELIDNFSSNRLPEKLEKILKQLSPTTIQINEQKAAKIESDDEVELPKNIKTRPRMHR